MMRPGIDYLIKRAGGYDKRLGQVVLPQWIYDRAKAEGVDLSGYVRQERIPVQSVNKYKPTLTLKR